MNTASRAAQTAAAAHIAGAVRLSSVNPQKTRWLWPGRIPLGRVTLLASDPGLGKSLLTLDIAARVSTGSPWPDEEGESGRRGEGETSSSALQQISPSPTLPISPSSVLLLTAEDDLADTIRPRLEALGADCDKILAISNVPGENAGDVPRAFALNRDLARLRNLLDALPDCRLLVIDPISAYLGSTNEHANADVQSLFTALATLARERDLAVLVVTHLRKKEGAAIYRTMGSLAFVAAARAVWTIGKDPLDSNKRLLLPIKNNLAPNATGLAFTIETSSENGAPAVSWLPETIPVTPELFLPVKVRPAGRPDHDLQYAKKWLQEHLAEFARPALRVRQDAEVFGITRFTLRRAFRALDGEAVRLGWPCKSWHWKLPTTPEKVFDEMAEFEKEFAESAKEMPFAPTRPIQTPPTPPPPTPPRPPQTNGGVRTASPTPANAQRASAQKYEALFCTLDDLIDELQRAIKLKQQKPRPSPTARSSPAPPISGETRSARTTSCAAPLAPQPDVTQSSIIQPPCPPNPASTSTTPPPAGPSPSLCTKPSTATCARSAPPMAAAATARPKSPTASSNVLARASPS